MIQDPDEWEKKTYEDIITKSQLEECDHSNFNWVFPKIGVPPNLPFNKVFHYKPSILGYHYFRKQPIGRVPCWICWVYIGTPNGFFTTIMGAKEGVFCGWIGMYMSHQNAAERLSKCLREKKMMEGQVIQRRMVGVGVKF